MPDQPRLAQLGERAEVFGDGVLPHPAQVDDIEVITPELAQILLDVPAQLVRPGGGAPLTVVVAVGADLGWR